MDKLLKSPHSTHAVRVVLTAVVGVPTVKGEVVRTGRVTLRAAPIHTTKCTKPRGSL
jgi:hypothetical protein